MTNRKSIIEKQKRKNLTGSRQKRKQRRKDLKEGRAIPFHMVLEHKASSSFEAARDRARPCRGHLAEPALAELASAGLAVVLAKVGLHELALVEVRRSFRIRAKCVAALRRPQPTRPPRCTTVRDDGLAPKRVGF